MFCTQCGTEVPDHSNFCTNCGNNLQDAEINSPEKSTSRARTSNKPELVIKPEFVSLVAIWEGLIVGLGLMIFVGVPAIGGIFVLNKVFQFGYSLEEIIMGFAVAFVVITMIFTYFQTRQTYKNTEYRFFGDKVEYYEGFFATESHTMNYKHITNTKLEKSIGQKWYKLGTITLNTASGQSITINDVENADNVYKLVTKLVEG